MSPTVTDALRALLEARIDALATELRGFTTTVVVGLLLEYLPDFIEKAAKSGTKQAWRKRNPLAVEIMEDRAWYPHWIKPFEILGAVMIVLGVSGELFTEFSRARLETELRSIDNSVVAEMGKHAAEANERAAQLEADNLDMRLVVEMRRHLKKTSSIKDVLRSIDVSGNDLVVHSPVDSEPLTLAGEIMEAAKYAGWKESIAGCCADFRLIRNGVEIWTEPRNIPGSLPPIKLLTERSWLAGDAMAAWLQSQGIHSVKRMVVPHSQAEYERSPFFGYPFRGLSVTVLVGNKDIDAELTALKEKAANRRTKP